MLAVALTNPAPPKPAAADRAAPPRPHQQLPAAQLQHPGEVLEILRRLLDPDEVAARTEQPRDRLRRKIDRGPARHVVGNDRQVRELPAHRAVPDEQRLLRRPRIIRRDHQRSVDPRVPRGARQLHGLLELRRPGPRNDRNAVADLRGHRPDHLRPLGNGLRTRLARGTADRDAVATRSELPAHQVRQAVEVDDPSGGERRHQRRDRPADDLRIGAETHESPFQASKVAVDNETIRDSPGAAPFTASRAIRRTSPASARPSDRGLRRARPRRPARR